MISIPDLRYWEWYKSPNVCKVYIHLLLSRSSSQTRYMGMVVPANSVVSSYQKLAHEIGLSKKEVFNAVNALRTTGYITISSGTKSTIFTLEGLNYLEGDTQ